MLQGAEHLPWTTIDTYHNERTWMKHGCFTKISRAPDIKKRKVVHNTCNFRVLRWCSMFLEITSFGCPKKQIPIVSWPKKWCVLVEPGRSIVWNPYKSHQKCLVFAGISEISWDILQNKWTYGLLPCRWEKTCWHSKCWPPTGLSSIGVDKNRAWVEYIVYTCLYPGLFMYAIVTTLRCPKRMSERMTLRITDRMSEEMKEIMSGDMSERHVRSFVTRCVRKTVRKTCQKEANFRKNVRKTVRKKRSERR